MADPKMSYGSTRRGRAAAVHSTLGGNLVASLEGLSDAGASGRRSEQGLTIRRIWLIKYVVDDQIRIGIVLNGAACRLSMLSMASP